MSLLVRLALVAGLALLAGGATIAPHAEVGGWTHLGLDHPPSAVHATLLEHLRWLLAQARPAPATVSSTGAFANAPAAAALAAAVLALCCFGMPRLWRPARLGVSWPLVALAREQRDADVAHAPPRPSSFA